VLISLFQVLLVACSISVYIHIICSWRISQVLGASKSRRLVCTEHCSYLTSESLSTKLLQCWQLSQLDGDNTVSLHLAASPLAVNSGFSLQSLLYVSFVDRYNSTYNFTN